MFLLLSFLLHSFLLGSFLLSSFLLTSRTHRIFLGFRVVVEQRCFSPRTSSDGCTTTYLFLVEASPVYMFVGSAHAHEARDKPAGTEAGQTDDAVLDNSTLAPPTGLLSSEDLDTTYTVTATRCAPYFEFLAIPRI